VLLNQIYGTPFLDYVRGPVDGIKNFLYEDDSIWVQNELPYLSEDTYCSFAV